MIRLENLRVGFSQGGSAQGGGEERIVLNDFNLSVPKGQTVSLIGSNGAGKSTVLNAIAGSVPILGGAIFLGERECGGDPEWMRALTVGRVRQNPLAGTAGEMTILDNLALASRKGPRRLRFAVTSRIARNLADKVADLGMGLENRLRENVSKLSGGQRQALTLLMAVLAEPSVLLLDEHTAALDPANADLVSELTKRFVRQYSLTALVVTHDMGRALSEADRIVMMHAGEVVADVEGEEKDRMAVADLVALFRKARGSEYAEDRDLLR